MKPTGEKRGKAADTDKCQQIQEDSNHIHILSNRHRIKVDFNNHRNYKKVYILVGPTQHMAEWQLSQKEIKKEKSEFLEMNENEDTAHPNIQNENTTYPNIQNTVKASCKHTNIWNTMSAY